MTDYKPPNFHSIYVSSAGEEKVTDVLPIAEELPESFLEFACDECKSSVIVQDPFHAGQAALVECSCGESYTLVSPPIIKYKTEEFDEIWSHIDKDIPEWKR